MTDCRHENKLGIVKRRSHAVEETNSRNVNASNLCSTSNEYIHSAEEVQESRQGEGLRKRITVHAVSMQASDHARYAPTSALDFQAGPRRVEMI